MAVTNVEHSVKAKKLTIEVDLTQDHGPSASGKTTVVGSTGGFIDTGQDGITFSLNVNKKSKK